MLMLSNKKNYKNCFLLVTIFLIQSLVVAQPKATLRNQEEFIARDLLESAEQASPVAHIEGITTHVPEFHDHPKNRIDQERTFNTSNVGQIDYQKKRDQCMKLVNQAVQLIARTSLEDACNAFTHKHEFLPGELYLFVYDVQGNCYAHGDDSHLIWQNLIDLKDELGNFIVKRLIEKGNTGGGWVTYQWKNSPKVTYVKKVVKDGIGYIVGCGYYPHSAEHEVVNLVQSAVALFKHVQAEGHSLDEAFSRMSYPTGAFVFGDLYLYAADFNGNLVAQGNRPTLIGTNVLNYQDDNGFYLNKEIINRLKKSESGIWINYISRSAEKRAYAEKVTDDKGNQYFIASGYYPDADRTAVVDLVRRGYTFMKGHGLTLASEEFTDKRRDDYRYGDLYLFVYDMEGKNVADGANESSVGLSQIDLKDQDGMYFIRAYIEKANAGGGWVNAKIRNSFQSTYVEKIRLGLNDYVIGSSLFPISKKDTLTLLVNSARDFLRTNNREIAFNQFANHDSGFTRGDLEVFVLDTKGLCYVYGEQYSLIWSNLAKGKTELSSSISQIISTASRGASTLILNTSKGRKIVYVETVVKNGRTYIVGSGYYL